MSNILKMKLNDKNEYKMIIKIPDDFNKKIDFALACLNIMAIKNNVCFLLKSYSKSDLLCINKTFIYIFKIVDINKFDIIWSQFIKENREIKMFIKIKKIRFKKFFNLF